MGLLTTLLAWHEADPVDEKEQVHNEVVYQYQHNRNPFVDHPEWVTCLFGASCGTDTEAPAAPAGANARQSGSPDEHPRAA